MIKHLSFEQTLNKFLPPHDIIYAETEKKEILGLTFFIAGVAVRLESGLEVFGSSCSTEADPIRYAAYECIERYIVKSIPPPNIQSAYCNFSISNGVALHQTIEQAKESALYELVEREEILRAWYFNSPISKIEGYGKKLFPETFIENYDVEVINFSNNKSYNVIGIFAFPKTTEHLMIYGFGCSSDINEAIQKSFKEFLMRLGFLWGEAPENETPDRKSGIFHQDFYLRHENHKYIKDWIKKPNDFKILKENQLSNLQYTNLTPSEWDTGLYILKASSPDTIPLFFGEPPKEYFDFPYRCDIPHPIP